MKSHLFYRRIAPGLACAWLTVTALVLSPIARSQSENTSALRLLEASGFNEILRLDAQSDGVLADAMPEGVPPELRAEIAGVLDRTMGYAEMRRATAQEISSRLDAKTIDRHLRFWASTTGRAVAGAQVAAFRELTETPPRSPLRQQWPYVFPLPDLLGTSRSVRECLRMTVSFRRECTGAKAASTPMGAVDQGGPDAADIMRSRYANVSPADLAAFKSYLDSPGAREVAVAVGDSYLRTRLGKAARARRWIAGAIEQFARDKIGSESEATLQKVITLIDEDQHLDEARLILHLLRGAAPSDPRIPVELARVAIKQGPLVAEHKIPGEPLQIDPEFLDDAQSWIDRAIALDPRRADTLVLAGHLAYLRYKFPESIALLEQARQLGTDNPWLRLNLADTLWAQARNNMMDRVGLSRAAKELEAALAAELPARMQRHANHSLAHIYGALGDVPKARGHFQAVISSCTGCEKVSILSEYADFLFLTANDIDGSIAASRAACREAEKLEHDVEQVHGQLAQTLLVKAGRLYVSGQRAEADRLVKEARREWPDVAQGYSNYAMMPALFPAVFAMHESGMIGDLSNPEGGRTLLLASLHESAADIERLIKWGADPNYLDAEEGTPLHSAIKGGNLVAVRTLLAHGADASARDGNNRLPLELAELMVQSPHPNNAEILAVLRDFASRNPAAAPVGAPLKAGYIYRALKPISGDRFGNEVAVGVQVAFVGYCRYTDDNVACLHFKNPRVHDALMDVALGKEQLVTWQDWFEEIGPEPAH